MKNYELIEHTADVGIRVKGGDLKELFINAAEAVFSIIAEEQRESPESAKKIQVIQEADNLDELFVNWLNELLSLSAVKELIFINFKINKLTDNNLEAEFLGRDMLDYRVNTEIKAATYHQLKIEKQDSGWLAEVIFDV